MARIVFTTFGSLGDLHPYLSLAHELRARGHRPTIATSAAYGPRITAQGLDFHPLRPDHPDEASAPAMMKRLMDPVRGSERVMREWVLPLLRQTHEDTLEAARGADLLVAHPLTFATRLVAEQLDIKWASTILSPISFFSPHDPPVLAPIPALRKLRHWGPRFHGPLFRLLKATTHRWMRPYRELRAELKLAPTGNPLFEGGNSPHGVVALFSPQMAAPQRDWPERTTVSGFPFYDGQGFAEPPPELSAFLDGGEPPIVFTLGSAAVMTAGDFYHQSIEAARQLGRRALFLVGPKGTNNLPPLPEGMMAAEYAPHALVFPAAAVNVHQGGIGTTAQAMRAGRPMLVVPFAHDQPDNAERMQRLGIGRWIMQKRFTARTAVPLLRELLDNESMATAARITGERIRAENGASVACDALERLL